jgi:hypothetical protein
VEVDVVSLAAEFPNDNPALHCGASWVCLEVTGPAVAVREEHPRLGEPIAVAEPEVIAEPIAVSEPEVIAEPIAVAEPAVIAEPEVIEVAKSEPEPQVVEAAIVIPEAVVVALSPVPMPVPVPVPVPDSVELVTLIALPEAPFEADAEAEAETELAAADAPAIPQARISCVVPAGTTLGMDAADADDDTEIVVEDLPPLDETACVEGAVVVAESAALPAASDDPFTVFLGALVDVALGAGSPHVASVLPGLLLEGRLEQGMAVEVLQALAGAKIASGTELTPAFVAQMNAWRAILRGTSDDFGACGAAMLDEWAADLVACLLGAPSRATALRRELRSHGVAAFGLAA